MKEKMIDWFSNRQIKSNLESYGFDYNNGRVGLCIEYIKTHNIPDRPSIDIACCSLYYNILNYVKDDLDQTPLDKKTYKQHIKKSWANICKNSGQDPNKPLAFGYNEKTGQWQTKS